MQRSGSTGVSRTAAQRNTSPTQRRGTAGTNASSDLPRGGSPAPSRTSSHTNGPLIRASPATGVVDPSPHVATATATTYRGGSPVARTNSHLAFPAGGANHHSQPREGSHAVERQSSLQRAPTGGPPVPDPAASNPHHHQHTAAAGVRGPSPGAASSGPGATGPRRSSPVHRRPVTPGMVTWTAAMADAKKDAARQHADDLLDQQRGLTAEALEKQHQQQMQPAKPLPQKPRPKATAVTKDGVAIGKAGRRTIKASSLQ